MVFEVRDTGVGISEEQQQIIFESFGQADSSTTRQFGGSGLGLSIASQLAEMMGGHMAVRSEVGQGSTFSFSAEFALPDEPATEPLHPAGLDGQRVLVVDDNSTNRKILDELLGSWGMVVSVVDSGESALAELERAGREGHSFALALLDVMMPRMDGFELARRIRERPELAVMRILMLTSAGCSDQEATRSRLDISRILLKPIKHSDLLVAITDALGVTTALSGMTGPGERPVEIAARQVLLVEDNPINQKVAKDLLTRRGHRIEVAKNGAQAVDRVSQKQFDVVLMDIHMPVMDGLTATRAIRDNERGKGGHVPIVAMTAGATMEDRERCFAAGMDGFVSKPFRADQLYRAVEDVTVADAPPGRQVPETEAAPAANRDVEPCLDWQGALGNLEGDEDLLIELIEIFFDQRPTLMAEIEAAISGEAAPDLQRAAHTLKGSAHIIGGRAAAAAALQLEHIGRDAKFEAATSALRTLETRVAELEAALQAAVQHRATSAGGG